MKLSVVSAAGGGAVLLAIFAPFAVGCSAADEAVSSGESASTATSPSVTPTTCARYVQPTVDLIKPGPDGTCLRETVNSYTGQVTSSEALDCETTASACTALLCAKHVDGKATFARRKDAACQLEEVDTYSGRATTRDIPCSEVDSSVYQGCARLLKP
jgi:hypothetical protein